MSLDKLLFLKWFIFFQLVRTPILLDFSLTIHVAKMGHVFNSLN